jgi:DNA-binding transcriptional regulator YdaS (Cro superfamily)
MKHLERAINIVGSQVALGKSIGVSQQRVWWWLNRGEGRVPAELCRSIEQATQGAVTVHDLRPDVFGPADQAA